MGSHFPNWCVYRPPYWQCLSVHQFFNWNVMQRFYTWATGLLHHPAGQYDQKYRERGEGDIGGVAYAWIHPESPNVTYKYNTDTEQNPDSGRNPESGQVLISSDDMGKKKNESCRTFPVARQIPMSKAPRSWNVAQQLLWTWSTQPPLCSCPSWKRPLFTFHLLPLATLQLRLCL